MSELEVAQTGEVAAPVENVEQVTPQESAPANPETPEEEQARDEKGRFVQKRINELTRQRYEAERRAQDLERRLAEVEQRQPSRAPDPNEDINGYLEHLANERAQAIVSERLQQTAQQQEQHRMSQIASQYSTREAEYIAAHPDYEEAVATFASVVGVNPQLGEVLMTSDHGPAVAHYLGTHLDEAVAIAQMPPHLAAAAVARLEAKVSAVKPKPVSSAPTPVPSVGGASVAPRGLHDELSIDDWMRERSTT